MKYFQMYSTIKKPSRFSADNLTLPSFLDMIWTNAPSACISGILTHENVTFLLVHFPKLNGPESTNESMKITFRLNNDAIRPKFADTLGRFDWTSIHANDLSAYTENFTKKLDELYCQTFPLKTKTISKRKIMNPWITPQIKELIDMRSTYFHMFRIGAVTIET